MKISKYHGLGNDFIITEYEPNVCYQKLAINLTKEHLSIGADGFIVVKKNPLEMLFYNKDGSMAPMCGNGIRCFSHYVVKNGILNSNSFDVKTGAGTMKVEVISRLLNDFRVKINMGHPLFDNNMIKASENKNYFGLPILFNNKEYVTYSFFMGTIHTVLITDHIEEMISLNIGPFISNNPLFKEKTNVNFVEKMDDINYKIRTFERGVGYTLACGTGACSAFVTLNKLGLVGDYCYMHLPYGILKITKENDNIYMEGPSKHVFDTEIEVDDNEI